MLKTERDLPKEKWDRLPQVVAQTVRVAGGPVSSFLGYTAYHTPWLKALALRLNPELETYFGEKTQSLVERDISQTYELLSDIHKRLENKGTPEHFIGKDAYASWENIRFQLEKIVNNGAEKESHVKVTDDVYFIEGGEKFVLFFTTDTQIFPVTIDSAFESTSISPIPVLREGVAASRKPSVSEELIIREELLQKLGHGRLRIMSQITNDFPLVRNFDLEHDGAVITVLRDCGVHTLSELQAAQHMYLARGIRINPDTGNILFDTDLQERVIR